VQEQGDLYKNKVRVGIQLRGYVVCHALAVDGRIMRQVGSDGELLLSCRMNSVFLLCLLLRVNLL